MDGKDHELTQKHIEEMVRPIPGDFVVYLLVGRRMKVLYFSDTILSAFGVTDEEFRYGTRRDALDVVMPSDREAVLATVYGKPVGDELIHCQFRLFHKKKGFFWVHSKSRIIGTMDGNSVILTNYLNASSEAESYSRILDDTTSAFFTVDVATGRSCTPTAPPGCSRARTAPGISPAFSAITIFTGVSHPAKTAPWQGSPRAGRCPATASMSAVSAGLPSITGGSSGRGTTAW